MADKEITICSVNAINWFWVTSRYDTAPMDSKGSQVGPSRIEEGRSLVGAETIAQAPLVLKAVTPSLRLVNIVSVEEADVTHVVMRNGGLCKTCNIPKDKVSLTDAEKQALFSEDLNDWIIVGEEKK